MVIPQEVIDGMFERLEKRRAEMERTYAECKRIIDSLLQRPSLFPKINEESNNNKNVEFHIL